MITQILPFDGEAGIQTALDILQTGGLIAFPTDTVYGVAAPAQSAAGIDRLYTVKGREHNKAIAVLIGSQAQLPEVVFDAPGFAVQLTRCFWPGALTLVMPKNTLLPSNLSPTATIGVRMPDHELLRVLIQRSGPLATTSANRSGGENSVTADDVVRQLGGSIEVVLDGGRTPGAVASTVVDCTGEKARILREGVISREALARVLGDSLLPG